MDDLDAALIGGREPRRIALARSVEHVGSTAVPGLAAKPVVDVLVSVDDPDDEGALVPPLESAGYRLRVREPGHRMLRTPGRDVHVHLRAQGSDEVRRTLAFRDRLRADAADRELYERVKRRLAARDWGDANEYGQAKTGVVEAILARPRP